MEDTSRPVGSVLEGEISSLPGVRAARVVGDDRGRIREVHVVADAGKPAKQIVRDIQTLALARFGVSVDYRTISVVQFEPELSGIFTGDVRPLLLGISWRSEAGNSRCKVDLALGDARGAGEAVGPVSRAGRLRLVAEAAAESVQDLARSGLRVDVVDVMLVGTTDSRVALVTAEGAERQRRERLVGAALVRTDESEAVARAVLDAMNRWIGPLLRPVLSRSGG